MIMDIDAIYQAKIDQVFADLGVNDGLQRCVNALLVWIQLVKNKSH
jgi:hypothetical protein